MAAEYSFSKLSFFAAVLVSGCLTVRIIIPPNRTPKDRAWRTDSLWFARSNAANNLSIALVATLVLYYAVLSVSPPSTLAAICPADRAGQRNPTLFTWSPVTTLSFLSIFIGAPIRLSAFTNLGKNFTFGLAKPSRLVTTGVYGYVQHPSYTGMALVAVPSFLTFMRLDGALACFIPPRHWPAVQAWTSAVYAGAVLLMVHQTTTRVRQEEAMLKEVFGKEWEEWHKNTKRFIPGLF